MGTEPVFVLNVMSFLMTKCFLILCYMFIINDQWGQNFCIELIASSTGIELFKVKLESYIAYTEIQVTMIFFSEINDFIVSNKYNFTFGYQGGSRYICHISTLLIQATVTAILDIF